MHINWYGQSAHLLVCTLSSMIIELAHNSWFYCVNQAGTGSFSPSVLPHSVSVVTCHVYHGFLLTSKVPLYIKYPYIYSTPMLPCCYAACWFFQELTEEGLPFLILFHHPDDTETPARFLEQVNLQLSNDRGTSHSTSKFL